MGPLSPPPGVCWSVLRPQPPEWKENHPARNKAVCDRGEGDEGIGRIFQCLITHKCLIIRHQSPRRPASTCFTRQSLPTHHNILPPFYFCSVNTHTRLGGQRSRGLKQKPVCFTSLHMCVRAMRHLISRYNVHGIDCQYSGSYRDC